MRELLRIGGMCVYDLLEEHFSLPLLKGALAFDAVLGTNFGPRSPGTVLTLLYRCARVRGGADALAQPAGGLGALCGGARASARAPPAPRSAPPRRCERILVREDRAAGVVLESGEEHRARDRGLERRSQDHLPAAPGDGAPGCGLRAPRQSACARAGCGEAAPRARAAAAVPRAQRRRRCAARLLVAPSLEYLERAYNHAKYGEFSAAPMLEITVPDAGRCRRWRRPASTCMSVIVQYAPYALAGGWDGQARGASRDRIIDTLARYAPRLRERIARASC